MEASKETAQESSLSAAARMALAAAVEAVAHSAAREEELQPPSVHDLVWVLGVGSLEEVCALVVLVEGVVAALVRSRRRHSPTATCCLGLVS